MFLFDRVRNLKIPLPKLFKWFLRCFFLLFVCSVVLIFSSFCFFSKCGIFFTEIGIFFLGFLVSFLFALFLFVRLLTSLRRVINRTNRINAGKRQINAEEDPFLDDEQGELYNLNRNLNKIHNYLRWQRRIISQESSELEAVISALSGAILAVDKNKKVLFFNNQATVIFSSQRRLQKREMYLSEIIRNPDILQMYSDCLKNGEVIRQTISFSIFELKEEPLVYEITVAPFKSENQKIQGAVAFFYDITEISKAEKIHSDFITNVSHELRTPLTAIQGYVETLLTEKDKNNAQAQKFLEIIKKNVERMASLFKYFLELSQIEGEKNLKKELFLDTKKLTDSVVKDLNIKTHEIKINIHQKTVKADPLLLKQILYNLIENAVKYTPKASVIEVIWKKQKDKVILKVKDNGPGVSYQHRSRLFERFYRVDSSRTGIQGAGVGLSIVKHLVEQHGGDIKLESQTGVGSVFICTFPDKNLKENLE
ncbi:MAG: PAS domain-containing protein [Bdellovibrionales bacterium]|nr:PAS domain-containing protein [Bdellovibrionales bacterium]